MVGATAGDSVRGGRRSDTLLVFASGAVASCITGRGVAARRVVSPHLFFAECPWVLGVSVSGAAQYARRDRRPARRSSASVAAVCWRDGASVCLAAQQRVRAGRAGAGGTRRPVAGRASRGRCDAAATTHPDRLRHRGVSECGVVRGGDARGLRRDLQRVSHAEHRLRLFFR